MPARWPAPIARRRSSSIRHGVFTNTNPVRPYRGNGRPEAAFIIERMVELAAQRTQHRQRRTAPAQLHPARHEMPFKTGLTFTYDCGEFEKNMDLAMELGGLRGLRETPQANPARTANFAASACPTRSSAPPRRAPKAPRCASTTPARVTLFGRLQQPGPGPRDRLQADRRRQARPPPRRDPLRPGRHRPGVLRRRHRRLALGDHGRLGVADARPTRSSRRRRAIAAHALQGRRRQTSNSPTACSRRQRPTGP